MFEPGQPIEQSTNSRDCSQAYKPTFINTLYKLLAKYLLIFVFHLMLVPCGKRCNVNSKDCWQVLSGNPLTYDYVVFEKR